MKKLALALLFCGASAFAATVNYTTQIYFNGNTAITSLTAGTASITVSDITAGSVSAPSGISLGNLTSNATTATGGAFVGDTVRHSGYPDVAQQWKSIAHQLACGYDYQHFEWDSVDVFANRFHPRHVAQHRFLHFGCGWLLHSGSPWDQRWCDQHSGHCDDCSGADVARASWQLAPWLRAHCSSSFREVVD